MGKNLGGSNYTRKSMTEKSRHTAGVNYLMRAIEEAAKFDVCVVGPMRAAPVELSPPRVFRVVRRYFRFGVQTGQSLIDFLGDHLRISDEMRYRIVYHRDWERALMYLDLTGNTAVRNAMGEERGN